MAARGVLMHLYTVTLRPVLEIEGEKLGVARDELQVG
jgi:hypothetical protein